MDHIEHVYTTGMDEESVETHLRATDYGVLALARDGEAYAIPVAYHYDDEGRVLLRLGVTADSEKVAFLETTDRATLVVEGTDGTDRWSVIARGPVRRLPAEEAAALDAADVNERFAPFRVFDEAVEDIEYELFALDPDAVTGRHTMEG